MKLVFFCFVFICLTLCIKTEPNFYVEEIPCEFSIFGTDCDNIVDPSAAVENSTTTCDRPSGRCICENPTWRIYTTEEWIDPEDPVPEGSCYKAVGSECSDENEDECTDEYSALDYGVCIDNACSCQVTGAQSYEDGAFCALPSSIDNNYSCVSDEQCDDLFGGEEGLVSCGGDDPSQRTCLCNNTIYSIHETQNGTFICGLPWEGSCQEEGEMCDKFENSVCLSGVCLCEEGAVPINNKKDCGQMATLSNEFSCRDDAQCAHIANHANLSIPVKCSASSNCQCPDSNGFSLQMLSEDLYACVQDVSCDDSCPDGSTCQTDVSLDGDKCQCSEDEFLEDDECLPYATLSNLDCEASENQCSNIQDVWAQNKFAYCQVVNTTYTCSCELMGAFIYTNAENQLQCAYPLGYNCIDSTYCLIDNSYCSSDGTCVCNDGYEMTSNKKSCSGVGKTMTLSIFLLLATLLMSLS